MLMITFVTFCFGIINMAKSIDLLIKWGKCPSATGQIKGVLNKEKIIENGMMTGRKDVGTSYEHEVECEINGVIVLTTLIEDVNKDKEPKYQIGDIVDVYYNENKNACFVKDILRRQIRNSIIEILVGVVVWGGFIVYTFIFGERT